MIRSFSSVFFLNNRRQFIFLQRNSFNLGKTRCRGALSYQCLSGNYVVKLLFLRSYQLKKINVTDTVLYNLVYWCPTELALHFLSKDIETPCQAFQEQGERMLINLYLSITAPSYITYCFVFMSLLLLSIKQEKVESFPLLSTRV